MNRRLFIFVIIIFVSTAIVTIFKFKLRHFPSKEEIDHIFSNYISESSRDQRVSLIAELLNELKNPRNVSEDHSVEYVVKRMIEMYCEKNDEAMLIAADSIELDAGFANTFCGFYYYIQKEKGFIERYSKNVNARKSLERCVGLVFSEREIENILNKN